MKGNLLKSKILTGALAVAMTVAMVPNMSMAEDVDAQAEEAARLEAESMKAVAEDVAPLSRERLQGKMYGVR